MQDAAQFVQLAQTLYYDLARAEKATDGKKALVDNPHEFLREITRVLADQQTHPILEQMLQTIQDDTVKEATGSASSAGGRNRVDDDQFQ